MSQIFGSIGQVQEITDEILSKFIAPEGFNSVYYGKTRQGKTRNATADIIELLNRGEIVFANWKINWEGYDERKVFGIVLLKLFFKGRDFYVYGKENFHYIDPIGLIDGSGDVNIKYLNRVVGAHLFIDEGQWVLPSQDRTYNEEMVDKMKLVLHGGHYCRSLNIITQRPQNISKNSRSQINVWYRCVKKFDMFGLMIFQRFAIEDMKNDEPVEFDDEGRPAGSCKTYFVNKLNDPVFKAYNTHAMRQKDAVDVPTAFEVYKLTFQEKAIRAFTLIVPERWLKRRSGGNSKADV